MSNALNADPASPPAPFMSAPIRVAPDIYCLPGWLPVPGAGLLPVNAFLLLGEEPVLIDTGLAATGDSFMKMLKSLIDPQEIRWIWLSHTDGDHIGNLAAVCAAAPQARLVTSFLGQGKLALLGHMPENVHLLEVGGILETRDRTLQAIRPPYYDAPETAGFIDRDNKLLFSGDAFGALLGDPANHIDAISPDALKGGLIGWAGIDSPWLGLLDQGCFTDVLGELRDFGPETILSGHLPPAQGRHFDALTSLAAEAQGAVALQAA